MSLRDTEVDKFNRNLDILLSNHNELKLAIHNKKNEASLESELVTRFILSVSVLWQSFIHDLFIAYISMDKSRAMASIKNRVSQSIQDRFGIAVSKNTYFKTPKRPSRTKIIELLDPKGWNISVTNSVQLSERANELLASRYAIKFSLDSANSEFYDYMVSLRNFLSHDSEGARKKFIRAINGLNEHANTPLKSRLNKIGPYLKAFINNNDTRAVFIIQRLRDLSNNL